MQTVLPLCFAHPTKIRSVAVEYFFSFGNILDGFNDNFIFKETVDDGWVTAVVHHGCTGVDGSGDAVLTRTVNGRI